MNSEVTVIVFPVEIDGVFESMSIECMVLVLRKYGIESTIHFSDCCLGADILYYVDK